MPRAKYWDGAAWQPIEVALPRPFESQITGDNSTLLWTIPHNLGTRNVYVMLRQNASPYEHVQAKVKSATTNSVTVETAPALAAGVVYDVMVAVAIGGANSQQSSPPHVTSLPSNPDNGQEVHYVADATNGIIWHLKYRAASGSAYKWEYVGGGTLWDGIGTAESTTGTHTTFQDLATVGPQVTLPLAGDYEIHFGATLGIAVANEVAVMAIKIGATATADAESIRERPTGTAAPDFSGARMMRFGGLPASTVLKAQYRSGGAATAASFQRRFLNVRPVRLG